MFKTCFISAGILLCSGTIASAQVAGEHDFHVGDANAPERADQSGLDVLTLHSSRPDFSSPLPANDIDTLRYDVGSHTHFKTNLAESFENTRGSGLLIEPRFSRLTSGDAGLESYSAEIRIGNVQFERSDTRPSGWYFFAATDGEAVSFRTDSITRVGDPMTVTLDDQITIGDIQAGISTYVFGGSQFTFSYIETEASYSGRGGMSNSKKESFAGFSLSREF